jgi:hypothetical protein
MMLFLAIFFLAFSFPLQVLWKSRLFALVPFAFLAGLFLLSGMSNPITRRIPWNTRRPMIFLVSVYLFLLFFNTAWQSAFFFITPEEAISALVIFFLPVLFFVYFSTLAGEKEIRVILIAAALIGLLTGAYFVYDSYQNLVLGKVSDYSFEAYEYAQMRAPDKIINEVRISAGGRSRGLLESNYISAGWVAIGCFAALTLIPRSKLFFRTLTILIYGIILLLGLNFTSIAGFAFVIVMIEFSGYKMIRGVFSKQVVLYGINFSGVIFLLASVLFLTDPESVNLMLNQVEKSIVGQVDLITGVKVLRSYEETTSGVYIFDLFYRLFTFPVNTIEYPLSFLIGDGFSTGYGVGKGGDFGIVETLHRFGLPFFVAIITGLILLIKRGLVQSYRNYKIQSWPDRYVWFSSITFLYIIFCEVHYSIWNSKSILPLVFVCLAIFNRYLVKHQRNYRKTISLEK